VTDIPSEATVSRGFQEFAQQQLPARIQEALIKATLGQTLVGHIARDGTAARMNRNQSPTVSNSRKT
jgi:hypothetical protein